MTLRTGLVITGDTEGAQKALDALAGGMARTGSAAQGLAAKEGVAEAATEGLAREVLQAKGAIDTLGAEAQQTGAALTTLGGRAAATDAQLARLTATGRGVVRSAGEQALGARMLGQQFQDVGLMIGMSGFTVESVMRAMSMQIGQVALAAEQMGAKGALGSAVKFLGGPYGGMILAATAILSPFIAKLFDSADAAQASSEKLQDAAESADSFGNAQTLLGQVIDLTTGKMRTQNAVLVQMIRLQVQANLAKAQGQLMDALGGRTNPEAGKPRLSLSSGMAMDLTNGEYHDANSRDIAERQRQADAYGVIKGRVAATANDRAFAQRDPEGFARQLGKDTDAAIASLDRLAVGGQIAGRKLEDVKLEVLGIATAGNDQAAAYASLDILNGGKVSPSMRPYHRDGKPTKPTSTEARDEFGRDAADRITGITEQFERTPAALRQANAAIRQLDDLIDDLGRKKPPNFQQLIASANAAKGIVRDGLIASIVEPFDMTPPAVKRASEAMSQLDEVAGQIKADFEKGIIDPATFKTLAAGVAEARGSVLAGLNRPFTDYIENQEQALQIQTLIVGGREDEAEAARVVFQLEAQMGPLSQSRKDAVLATVQALRAEQREMEILRQKQQGYLNALGDVRSMITQTIYEGANGLAELPARMLDTFKRFYAEWLTEKLFGDLFRKLQDQVTGTHIVEGASKKMALAVDGVTDSIGRFEDALDGFATRLNADGSVSVAAGMESVGHGHSSEAMAKFLQQYLGANDAEDIVVTGRKRPEDALGLKDPKSFFSDAMGDVVSTLLKGVGIGDESAEKIGKFAGKYTGAAMKGAMEGQLASGIASMLGIKQSSTGAAIGGGIGGMIGEATGIPGLGFLGGLFGGTIGTLFEKPKYGTANVSSVYDKATTSGSNAAYGKAAGGLADQVRDGVKQIAEQLGGVIGNFDLSIGTFNDRYRVNTFGTDKALHSKNFGPNSLFDFGDDEAAAISFAIADAIKDGGVTGLSAAVQQALRSSTDIQDALQEAMKVANVEQMMGGLEAEISRAFRDFEREAAERLRIAREYGFDVVELEKRNAEDRLKLSERLLDEQVGSLQRLVDEITHGSMFEGSAVDREAKLREAIAAAEADLNAGKEGAADRVAELYGQLNAVLKEVYGTTGGFATGQAEIVDKAQAAIARANERIRDAQAASDPALQETNAALDENNDQNSKILEQLAGGNALMTQIVAALASRDGNLLQLARTS